MTVQGVKKDDGKPRVDLVPPQAVLAAARAFTFGAKKYSPWNWMKGLEWLRLYAAVLRHLYEWFIGVTVDKESGLHPLDHAIASLMMLQVHDELKLGKDDRAHVVIAEQKVIPAASVPVHTNTKYYIEYKRYDSNKWKLIKTDRTKGPFSSRELANLALYKLEREFGTEGYEYRVVEEEET